MENKLLRKKSNYIKIGVGILVLIILFIVIRMNQNDKIITDSKNGYLNKSETTSKIQKQSSISNNTKQEIKKLVEDYYDMDTSGTKSDNKPVSHVEIRDGIEFYKNIKVNIRNGLDINQYIVFSTYDMKFLNIDTLAPGMSVLSIRKEEDGLFHIEDNKNNEKLNQYVQQLTKEEEIKNIIENVNKKLTSAVKKDERLKDFVNKLENIKK